MKCRHQNRTFITYMEVRGYPEKLFICSDCGMTISDFVSNQDRINYVKEKEYVPSITLGLVETTKEVQAALYTT